ncbi:hypothetical protein LTR80_012268, partial [Exophiala xenobiotica]
RKLFFSTFSATTNTILSVIAYIVEFQLILSDRGLEILVGMFVFARNKTPDPWIGHVTGISSNSKHITVEWMCNVNNIEHADPYRYHRCPDEMFLTPFRDRIDVDTIEDIAEINFHHDERHCDTICWRQHYNSTTGQFIPERLSPG